MIEKKVYSAPCPNLTLNRELIIKKFNSDRKTKSLPNMSLIFNEIELKKKTISVENILKTEDIESMKPLEKLFSASCPNLTLNRESIIENFNSDRKTKSLPDMALTYSDELEIEKGHNSEILAEMECVQEEIEVPKKKRQTIYKRVERFFKCLCCCSCIHLIA